MDGAVQQWLEWFWQNADFGPADSDVKIMLEEEYERITGRTVPPEYSYRGE